MNPLKLFSLAKRINGREDTIEQLRKGTIDKCNETLAEVILQGQDLHAAKAAVSHGQWLDWLKAHCAKTTSRMAQRYMLIATNMAKNNQLTEAGSLRAALALCDTDPTNEPGEPHSLPAYLEAIYKASKFLGYVSKHPIDQWPVEGLDKLRQDFAPLASQLWPDKFDA